MFFNHFCLNSNNFLFSSDKLGELSRIEALASNKERFNTFTYPFGKTSLITGEINSFSC